MKGIIAGICAGIAGAILWAVIAAVTGFEIGWLAWGIGAAVGAAVAWGSEGTPAMGVVAVVIALLAIVAGKYITVEMVLHKELSGSDELIAALLDDEEYMISCLADDRIAQLEEAGQTVNWPDGVYPEDASVEADYPPAIWAEAKGAWSQMPDEDRADFKDEIQGNIEAGMSEYLASVKQEGFLASFGLFDAIFFFLAVGTAYKMGSKAD